MMGLFEEGAEVTVLAPADGDIEAVNGWRGAVVEGVAGDGVGDAALVGGQ